MSRIARLDDGLSEAAESLAGIAFATITGQTPRTHGLNSWGRRRSYEPPVAWAREVHRIAPRSDRYSWLHLVWVAGDPWAPIQRWCLYQMVPKRLTPPWIAAWLNGPNPRTMGYWSPKHQEWVSKAPPISELQWRLWREVGGYGQLWWVIQGEAGGHRASLSDFELKLVKLRGYNGPWPEPGDLPYAPYDGRVSERVMQFDKMQSYRMMAEFAERSPEQLESEEHDVAAMMRQQLGTWLYSQIEGAVESSPSIAPSALPTAAPGFMSDMDRVDHDFLHES